jgi:nucleotide-binding universal stress UspA family protein
MDKASEGVTLSWPLAPLRNTSHAVEEFPGPHSPLHGRDDLVPLDNVPRFERAGPGNKCRRSPSLERWTGSRDVGGTSGALDAVSYSLEAVMTRIKKVLVPTDFSSTSDVALDYARGLSQALGASLVLLHVFEDPLDSMYTPEMYVPVPTELRDALWHDAEARLRSNLAAATQGGIDAEAHVITGRAWASIVEYSTRHSIDLIVMGTHGRGGMAHVLLGSVAERVVRSAPCPVLTVRARREADKAAAAAAPAA